MTRVRLWIHSRDREWDLKMMMLLLREDPEAFRMFEKFYEEAYNEYLEAMR